MTRANQWAGQYGRAIAAVDHAVKTGTDFRLVAKSFKVHQESMRISANNRGLLLPGVRPNKNYGKVKQSVIEGDAASMTYAEVSAKTGYNLQSLYRAAAYLGLTLRRKRTEQTDASIAQSVEHPPCKRKVVGSTPTAGSTTPTNA